MQCSMHKGIVIILVLGIALEKCQGCPPACVCKWKSGKQTVECIEKGLIVIPDGMDSGTQVLEFYGNNLQTLHRGKFLKMDLINLQRIYLSRCHISSIDNRAFKGLRNLVELDLSGNSLEDVPTGTFMDCSSLMRLTLSLNPIKTVRRAAFSHLSFLTTLELSNCEISIVEEDAFDSLYSLEWLYLNGNKMSAISGMRYLPESLKGLQLQDNPWNCDCHILDLHNWLTTSSMQHSIEPTCVGPQKFHSKPIKSVASEQLACLPDVSPTTFYLEIGEGKNVSLLCQVQAIPEATVSWWFQGQLLQNDSMIAPGVHLLYYIEEGKIEKRSELFIHNTNAEDNGTFICNAENPAGVTQANFTIRVVVKHESSQNSNELPSEFILIVMSAAAVSVLLLLLLVMLSIIKCHRNSRLKKKRNNSKVALSNSTKDNLLQDAMDEYSGSLKENSNAKSANEEEGETPVSSLRPLIGGEIRSPLTLKRYQESNPDLINGTESVAGGDRRRIDDITAYSTHFVASSPGCVQMAAPISEFQQPGRDPYMFAPDVHLNPVGLLNPNTESRSQTPNCYRTLPYRCKRPTAANPATRYSREAEFLSRTSRAQQSFEHYCQDVRYTADGYPPPCSVASACAATASPDSLQSDSVEACCSGGNFKWPSCVPANLRTGSKVSVGAQTQTDLSTHRPLNKMLEKIQETLNESPDEGFEGDCLESATVQSEEK